MMIETRGADADRIGAIKRCSRCARSPAVRPIPVDKLLHARARLESRPASMKRIPSLDGLRALSISLVLVAHLAGTHHFFTTQAVAQLGDLGNLGVRMFFVISGFLITKLLLVELDRTQRISLKAFYIRRLLRIFPAFYVFIIIASLLGL